jgi:hypothetical protein
LPGFKLDLPSSKIASKNNKIQHSKIAECEIIDPPKTGWSVDKANILENDAPHFLGGGVALSLLEILGTCGICIR